MTTILAIDAATIKTGYGLIKCNFKDVKLVDWGRWTLKGELHQRLAHLQEKLTAFILEHKPDVVAVEDLKFNRGTPNLSSMTKVAFAIGVVHATFAKEGYNTIYSIPANSVRKVWEVEQKNGKKHLREAINKKFESQLQTQGRPFGFEPSDEDVTDAIGLAVATWVDIQKSNRKNHA